MSAPAMLGVAAAAVLLGVPLLAGSAATAAGARAGSAADAAALAAADALAGLLEAGDGIMPCELAAEVAGSGGGRLARCAVEGGGVVRVRVTAKAGPVVVERCAKAGPSGGAAGRASPPS